MVLSSRLHVLCYGGMLLLGLMDVVLATVGERPVYIAAIGALYVAIAAYRLAVGRHVEVPVFAVQRVY